MRRFVIINHRSGYIVAVFHAETPVNACRRFDQMAKVPPRRYESVPTLNANDVGYRVYDIDDMNIPTIINGQDAHVIEMIETECPLVAQLRST